MMLLLYVRGKNSSNKTKTEKEKILNALIMPSAKTDVRVLC